MELVGQRRMINELGRRTMMWMVTELIQCLGATGTNNRVVVSENTIMWLAPPLSVVRSLSRRGLQVSGASDGAARSGRGDATTWRL